MYNGNVIKSNDFYDIRKSIHENFVDEFERDAKFEKFALVDDVLTETSETISYVPKIICVYQVDFFKKSLVTEEFPKNVHTESTKVVRIEKRKYELFEELRVPSETEEPIRKKANYDKSKKMCIEPGCNVAAGFGPVGQKKIHCAQHRQKNDVIYSPRRRCHKCSGSFSYQQWYFHSKVCGVEGDSTCNKCGCITVNLFKHKYTCKKRNNVY
jgi:hypothetical protein